MLRCSYRIGGLVLLSYLGLASTAIAADPPKSTTPKPVYITLGDLTGEITKVDSSSITLRVNWKAQPMPKITGNTKNPAHLQQEMARQMEKANKEPEQHKEYTMSFTTDAQARTQQPPPNPKVDTSGKSVPYTPAEKQKLKGNATIPGWKADLSELKVGQKIEAHVVALKGTPVDKTEDWLVRWAVILSEPSEKKQDDKKN